MPETKISPKVSVLMPSFNSLPYVRPAVESILCQTFKDFEFIIVDDGSTDGSEKLLEEYSKYDRRIHIVRNEKNMGIVSALNRGLKKCNGDYVARMDADDIALPDRLEKQLKAMEADSSIDVLGGSLTYINSSGKEIGITRCCELNNSILTKTPLLHPTVMIRRETLIKNNLCYLEKYCYAEDYFLWMQISKVGRLSAINDVVIKYRLSAQATRVKHLKKVLWATFKAKRDGIFLLGIRPALKDIFIMLGELTLFLLPSFMVLKIYFKINFKKNLKAEL